MKTWMPCSMILVVWHALAAVPAHAATNYLQARWNTTAQGTLQYQYKGSCTKSSSTNYFPGSGTFYRCTPAGAVENGFSYSFGLVSSPGGRTYGPHYTQFTAPNNTYNCKSMYVLIVPGDPDGQEVWSALVDPDTSPWP